MGLIWRIQIWSKSIGGLSGLVMASASVPEVGLNRQHPVWPDLLLSSRDAQIVGSGVECDLHPEWLGKRCELQRVQEGEQRRLLRVVVLDIIHEVITGRAGLPVMGQDGGGESLGAAIVEEG